MFTKYDKAVAALIGALSVFTLEVFGIEIDLDEPTKMWIAGAISGILTFLIPNKET